MYVPETVTKWQVQCGGMQNKIHREWEEKQVRGYTSINDTAPSVLVTASHGGGHQCTEVLVAREQQLCSTVWMHHSCKWALTSSQCMSISAHYQMDLWTSNLQIQETSGELIWKFQSLGHKPRDSNSVLTNSSWHEYCLQLHQCFSTFVIYEKNVHLHKY